MLTLQRRNQNYTREVSQGEACATLKQAKENTWQRKPTTAGKVEVEGILAAKRYTLSWSRMHKTQAVEISIARGKDPVPVQRGGLLNMALNELREGLEKRLTNLQQDVSEATAHPESLLDHKNTQRIGYGNLINGGRQYEIGLTRQTERGPISLHVTISRNVTESYGKRHVSYGLAVTGREKGLYSEKAGFSGDKDSKLAALFKDAEALHKRWYGKKK